MPGVGQLSDRVTIQQPTFTAGVPAWPTLATVYAAVEPWATQRDEAIAGEAPKGENRYRVTMWYRADVTPTMRLQWTPFLASTAKTLDISAVSLLPDRLYMRLDCVEVL